MSGTGPIPTPWNQRVEDFKRRTLPVIVWSAAALVVAVLMFSRTARYDYIGVAEMVEYEIAATAPGRVDTVAVDVYDDVEAGEIVAVLDDSGVRARLDTAHGVVARLQAELEAERVRLEADRDNASAAWVGELRRFQIDEESRRLDALELQVVIENDRVELDRLELERRRSEALVDAGFISDSDYDTLRLQRDQVKRRIEENQLLLARTRDELHNAETRRADYQKAAPRPLETEPILTALSQAVDEESRRLAELELERQALALRSPVVGQVNQILARRGAAVVAGEPILTVADPQVREVIVYLRPSDPPPQRNSRVRVTSRGGRTRTETEVVRLGPGLQQLPNRFWTDPRVADYGYPVVVAASPAMRLTPGELVSVRFLDR